MEQSSIAFIGNFISANWILDGMYPTTRKMIKHKFRNRRLPPFDI